MNRITEWYNPPTIQMLTILIMKRSQKPVVISGHSLTSCSLESFTDVSFNFTYVFSFSKQYDN